MRVMFKSLKELQLSPVCYWSVVVDS